MAVEEFEAGYEQKVIVNWTIPQGSLTQVAVRPYDLTDPADKDSLRIYTDWTSGWTARAQIRKKPAKSNTEEPWVTFVDGATSGPRISMTSDGWIYAILPGTATEGEPWNGYSGGFWDLEVIPDASPDDAVRMIAGTVKVSHDVTREVTA